MKLGIVLFNLGGPDSPEAVEPFLRNLFSDPAIISLPGLVRMPLARFIARRRAPLARAIYDHIGGRSPILEETQKQARALEQALAAPGIEATRLCRHALLASLQRRHRAGGEKFRAPTISWRCRSIRNIPPPPARRPSRIGIAPRKKPA